MDALVERGGDLAGEMKALGARARVAARLLATAPTSQKNAALHAMAGAVASHEKAILAANAGDIAAAKAAGKPASYIDRLTLDQGRIAAIVASVEDIAALDDPVGQTIAAWERPNGLKIERVRTPLGVIGIIFESRPNVTADAGCLCLKAGNAAILRPGSDSFASASAIHAALGEGLCQAGLPADAIQIVPTVERAAVGIMLNGLGGSIDVIVPRGGRNLVERVERDARVPVFSHLEGICHVYVHAGADLAMARSIVVNAKMRRTGICGAAECLLIDKAVAETHLRPLIAALIDAGCQVRGDAGVQAADARVAAAAPDDFGKEFLDAIIAARLVDGLDAAVQFIAAHGSQHTDCIITDDRLAADAFMNQVDSAIVLHNASTQFADGGEFGMGAEIGIATGRLHARGPVGVEQLTSFKYRVRGTGQVRS